MTVTVDCAINSTPSTLLSTIALQGRTGDWEDELVIRKSEGKFQVIREHQHPLYRFVMRIVSCVTDFFETIMSAVCRRPISLSDRSIKQLHLTETITSLSAIFGPKHLHRAAAWCGIDLSDARKGRCLTKQEVSTLFHSLSQITAEDVNELLEELNGPAESVRLLTGEPLKALRDRFAKKSTIESCSFDDIRTLERVLLPCSDPDHLFWDDPASHFNSLFGSSSSVYESVGWACHVLRTQNLPLKDWEAVFAKRLTQPALPQNLLIAHPNGAYLQLYAQIEGGGASKRFFRTLHPDAADPLILYRGTRGPSPETSFQDVVHSWLEDLRRELGASGPIATYEQTKHLLEDPALGFVTAPEQEVCLLANSIGGPQAMRDTVLFNKRIRRLTTNSSPGVDRETAELFRRVMASPRATPMTIIHNIDRGDIIDTMGDEHIGGDCENVTLTFRALRPADESAQTHSSTEWCLTNHLRDFLLSGTALVSKIIGIFEAHMRATTAGLYREETISTDNPTTKKLAADYARHLPPHFDPSWEGVRRFLCPAPSPGFAAFASQQLGFQV
jgi:hypothetical protein